jgi:hypothetical protein
MGGGVFGSRRENVYVVFANKEKKEVEYTKVTAVPVSPLVLVVFVASSEQTNCVDGGLSLEMIFGERPRELSSLKPSIRARNSSPTSQAHFLEKNRLPRVS